MLSWCSMKKLRNHVQSLPLIRRLTVVYQSMLSKRMASKKHWSKYISHSRDYFMCCEVRMFTLLHLLLSFSKCGTILSASSYNDFPFASISFRYDVIFTVKNFCRICKVLIFGFRDLYSYDYPNWITGTFCRALLDCNVYRSHS